MHLNLKTFLIVYIKYIHILFSLTKNTPTNQNIYEGNQKLKEASKLPKSKGLDLWLFRMIMRGSISCNKPIEQGQ